MYTVTECPSDIDHQSLDVALDLLGHKVEIHTTDHKALKAAVSCRLRFTVGSTVQASILDNGALTQNANF